MIILTHHPSLIVPCQSSSSIYARSSWNLQSCFVFFIRLLRTLGSQIMPSAKLNRFPRSGIWDEKTQQIVDGLRAFMHREPQPTISHIQNESIKARPLKGSLMATRDILRAPPEDDVRQLLFEAIMELGDAEYEAPNLAHVPVEWIVKSSAAIAPGHQVGLTSSLHEKDSGIIILHVHGGAFLYVFTPHLHRQVIISPRTARAAPVPIDLRQRNWPLALAAA